MPIILERTYKAALLVGRDAAEDRVFFNGICDVLVGFERASVYILLRALYPGPLCDLGDGHGIVAGDDLYSDALFGEILEGVGRFGAYLV